ncbi:hypothetical protein MSAN_01105600 [Mycena sanguinolenta]|uniref:Ribonuclease H1 N-terminal domain-containing protein n=1 Tax=Mycena sanguinolenta TaxID=230812 RepID=A0A8H6YV58_9AGAR|nr:hypothetical protein MSAN_01105600 [Mycena sanguinolenta]
MTSFTTAANTAPNARSELMAVLATVDDLVARTARLSTIAVELQKDIVTRAGKLSAAAVELQQTIPSLFERLEEEIRDELQPDVPSRPAWVEEDAKTPAQVTADHANLSDGSCVLWVVYVGREPGIYTTSESADAQIKGCPHQQYRCKHSKREALDFYAERYAAGAVHKMVPVVVD